uniref:Uncharacterized protein n=1 Tax=Oryza punctata TaxID=4537 RepID=A0A0E0LGV4_ORYPU
MAFDVNGAIGQLKNPIICNCCCTIKGEVSAGEARIDELVLTHGDGKVLFTVVKEEIECKACFSYIIVTLDVDIDCIKK